MFFKKSKILHLIKTMENTFWQIESQQTKEEKEIHKNMDKKLRNNIRFLIVIYQLALLGYFAPFFIDGQKLVFECYRPQWLSYYVILFMEEYACLMTIFLPINVTDFLFLILSTETTKQFMLLNQEFNRIYSMENRLGKMKEHWKFQLRKCIKHHIFLLE